MGLRSQIGTRIRRKRLAVGLTQSALAKGLGISPSYLNLIEKNKRAIGGSLLLRIGERLGADLGYLSDDSDLRAIAAIGELLADPVMQGIEIEPSELREAIGRFPEVAAAILRLYRAYSDVATNVESLQHRLQSDPFVAELLHDILNQVAGIRSSAEIIATTSDLTATEQSRFAKTINSEAQALAPTVSSLIGYFEQTSAHTHKPVSPMSEVEEAFITHHNHFPVLEDVAEELSLDFPRARPLQEAELSAMLWQRFGIECRVTGDASRVPLADEIDEQIMVLPEAATRATRIFAMLQRYTRLAAHDVLARTAEQLPLESERARRLAERALSSYVAGAIVMPYDRFVTLAEERRYDVELICNLTGASFEQVAHRLVTLRRKGSEGVPFGFLRADAAGRLTKRFTLPGLTLPASGHGCLLWPIYRAFWTSGIVRQISTFPGGARFLQFAKRIVKTPGGFDRQPPTFAIMLSCDMLHADRTVYGQDLDIARDNVETGPSCLLCPRLECPHRNEVMV